MSKWEVDRATPPSDPGDPRGRRVRFELQPPEVVEAETIEITPGGALIFADNGEPVRAFGPTGWVSVKEWSEPVMNPNPVPKAGPQ